MPSIPSSPTIPSQRRRSLRLSNFDNSSDASPSQYTSGTTNSTAFSRRSSRTSQTSYNQASPITPRQMSTASSRRTSFHNRRKSSSRLSIGSNASFDMAGNGLGNLADELEDALEDESEIHGDFADDMRGEDAEPLSPTAGNAYGSVPQSPPSSMGTLQQVSPTKLRSPNKEKRKSRHQRTESKYDGSDYGPESDQDDDGLPTMLIKRMGDIEALARMSINAEDTLSEGGGVVQRTAHALKDLGPQAVIENHLSRIITAYTSMATHRAHKTRDLFGQAHSLLYGNILELSEEMIDVLLSEVNLLYSTTPFLPQHNPLVSLQMLASQTVDLAQTLRSLTDVLHESRISSNAATRKLKSVKDMVEELRVEEDLTEDSMMLIQAGDWDRRCRERQAAAMCREVISGFGKRWDLEPEDRPWMRKREVEVN